MNTSLTRRERAQAAYEAGQAKFALAEYAGARADYESAVALYPMHAPAHLGLSKAHRNLGQWAEAERSARAALEADPAFAAAAHYLGALLVELDRLAEALPFLQAAADWAPEVAQHQRDLGVAQLFLGDIEGARRRLLATIDLDVHSHEVLYTLIRMWPMDDGSAEAERLLGVVRELAERAGALPPAEQAQVWFALGKAHEDRGEIEAAVEAYRRANAVKRAIIYYDIAEVEARSRHIARMFDADVMARLAGNGDPSNRPIFIVGMPRSGSTLVEQILSAHPEVHGAGEVHILPPILEVARGLGGTVYPDWAPTMNAVDCGALGRAYLERLPTGLPGQSRTTDKWLENFEHLGLIALMLPNAAIIHCHRDPRDQLMSCWSLLFSQNQSYAYHTDELVRYYRAYERLMAHWRAVLPAGRMLEMPYEDLVADTDTQVRRLLDHCGLEWDDHSLRFWEARRPVKSASMFQVRKPIYDQSIGRWRPFAKHLPALLGAFD
jgi:tetratricopeptide (TPR) repeat protein